MDPSCGCRILLFEALLIFQKFRDALDNGLPNSTDVWHLLFVRRLRTWNRNQGDGRRKAPFKRLLDGARSCRAAKKRGSTDEKKSWIENSFVQMFDEQVDTLLGTNISHQKGTFESMIFLFPRWDMLVPWRVICCKFCREVKIKDWNHQLGAPHFLVHRIPPWSDPLRTVVSRLFFVAFHLDAQDSQTWESLTMDY